MNPGDAVADTRRWLERAVIGLNLCPFAKGVLAKHQVHFAVSDADDAGSALQALDAEADALLALDAGTRDTTLLILPDGFGDFLAFHELVRQGERRLRKRGLQGVLQLASFHPRFAFADAPEDDISHFTNRAPHPTLHLLREDSVERAVAAFPDASRIYDANIEALRRLGRDGWNALDAGTRA